MARRASSSFHPGVLIVAAAVVIVAIVAGKMMLGKKSSGFTDAVPLEVQELLQNGNMLRGNEYVVVGEVDEKLFWDTAAGQVISLKVGDQSQPEFIGIQVPPKFNDLNVAVKQRYSIRVKFRDGGIPVATGIERL